MALNIVSGLATVQKNKMSTADLLDVISEFEKVFPWFEKCADKFDATNNS
jgi:hypothetical protein